jgi:hypothetical protein
LRNCGNKITSRIDGRIGQEHYQAVNADALAGRGGHAVFQGPHIILIHVVRLFVTPGLLGACAEETLLLVPRVIQFGEGIGHFPASAVEFETIDYIRVMIIFPGKRRNLCRVGGYKGRLDQFGLGDLLEYLDQSACRVQYPAGMSRPISFA